MGIGFQFEQHRLGLWDLIWDLKKTICREMGLGPPLHDPQVIHKIFKMKTQQPVCLYCHDIVFVDCSNTNSFGMI